MSAAPKAASAPEHTAFRARHEDEFESGSGRPRRVAQAFGQLPAELVTVLLIFVPEIVLLVPNLNFGKD